MERQNTRPLSKDISITMWGLVIVFAIISSVAAYSVLVQQLQRSTVSRMSHLTQEVARQSAYTLLAADTSPAVAERFASSFVGVKDVRLAVLLNENGIPVAQTADPEAEELDTGRLGTLTQTTLLRDTFRDLHVVSPVFLKTDWNANETPRPFGYVYVISGKETARRLALNVSLANVAIVVMLGTALLVWATRRTRRLTRPLESLVATMNSVTTTPQLASRAEVRGAAECRAAAVAFNELMNRLTAQQEELRAYAELLEARVAERTQELEKATIAAQAAARYKSEVMASVTHEMKAPLYVIGVYAREASADLAMSGAETEAIRSHLSHVIAETEELSEKITQILQVARLEKGAYEVKREWMDLESLCERLMTRLRMLAKTNRNELTHGIAGRPRIWCDPQIVEQIIMTIGTNACKFTRDGRIAISLAVTSEAVHINVDDTGAGIAPDVLPNVFEEFRQGEMGESRSFPGTGLGLSIAKRYADLLEGTITIRSEVGQGTHVEVRIPLETPLSLVAANATAMDA